MNPRAFFDYDAEREGFDKAKNIISMLLRLDEAALVEIFASKDIGDILRSHDLLEIKDDIDNWKSKQIQVGDIVICKGTPFLVSQVGTSFYVGIARDGAHVLCPNEDVKLITRDYAEQFNDIIRYLNRIEG